MKKTLIALFVIGLLTACSDTTNYHYKFVGESEHWEAKFDYSGKESWGKKDGRTTYDNKDHYDFELKYKGSVSDLSTMKQFEYKYKTTTSGGSSQITFDQPTRDNVFKSSGGSNGLKLLEDEMIQVHVKWDDHEETFELKKK